MIIWSKYNLINLNVNWLPQVPTFYDCKNKPSGKGHQVIFPPYALLASGSSELLMMFTQKKKTEDFSSYNEQNKVQRSNKVKEKNPINNKRVCGLAFVFGISSVVKS